MKILERWYAKNHPGFDSDAAKVVEENGQIYWTHFEPGSDILNPMQDLFTEERLRKRFSSSSLLQVVDGKFGPPDWTAEDNHKTIQITDTSCVCTMQDLWRGGCPSARNLKCKSKK